MTWCPQSTNPRVTIMEGPPYYLSKHTYLCLANNHYVFLDLRSDEYLCLARTHTDTVAVLLNNHTVFSERSFDNLLPRSCASDLDVVAQALLNKELLVQDLANGKLPAPPNVDAPVVSLMEDSSNPRPRIEPLHVWNFFAAAAAASKSLRWESLEQTVRKVEARKSTRASAAAAVDNGIISDLFSIFQTLRPYFPRPYLCLFDSLALVDFLARFSVFPQWVYGVKLEPFAAHCWVQAGDLVINDGTGNVCRYTPIMSV